MRTLYLRNVPEVAVLELSDVSRRADNAGLLGRLADLNVDTSEIVDGLAQERAGR